MATGFFINDNNMMVLQWSQEDCTATSLQLVEGGPVYSVNINCMYQNIYIYEQLSNYWLKFKIDQIEDKRNVQKFNKSQKTYGMSAEDAEQAEKDQTEKEQREIAQQKPHVKVTTEE